MGKNPNIIGIIPILFSNQFEMMDPSYTQKLDARDIEGEPFEHIMESLNELEDDGCLLLINSFEPKPLYQILESKGYTYESSQIDEDEWHIQIEKR